MSSLRNRSAAQGLADPHRAHHDGGRRVMPRDPIAAACIVVAAVIVGAILVIDLVVSLR